MTTWRQSELAKHSLELQGYWDSELRVLNSNLLGEDCTNKFLEHHTVSAPGEYLTQLKTAQQLGLTAADLLDAILPGFREKNELTAEETKKLRTEPEDCPELAERDYAVSALSSLLWGTVCKDSHNGDVQRALQAKNLVLVTIREGRPAGKKWDPIKVATDDVDIILNHYVEERGAKLVSVSATVRDDCLEVAKAVDGIIEPMKERLGRSLTGAMVSMLPVARPNLAELTGGTDVTPAALGTGGTGTATSVAKK